VWQQTPGDAPYEVELARDAGFVRIALRRSSAVPSLVLPPLPPGHRYHWRVRRGSVTGPPSRFELPAHRIPY
jgi:hypothetical protein